jgi:hypothetical protein
MFPSSVLWYNASKRMQCAAKGASNVMTYIHAIAAGDPGWVLYAASLLAGVLPDGIMLILRRGFGFGRRRGSLGLFRILFVVLFTTVLGPIVLVALIAFFAYSFFVSRRRR